MKKTKWVVLAGLMLAIPTMSVLSGCGGGNNGGVGLPVFGANAFAGAQATGQLLNALNQVVGNVAFQVANDGTITGTLTADSIAGNAVRAVKPRATATNGTGTVGSDGNFTLTFDVRTTANVNGVVTLHGRLLKNGTVITAQDTTFESPFAGFSGTYSLSITTTVPNPGGGGGGGGGGGTGNGSGTFSISNANGSNVDTGAFSASTASATAIRVNNKITLLTITFVQTSATLPRTVTISIGDGVNTVVPGTYTTANGAGVVYTETSVGTQQTRGWSSNDTGSVTLNSLSATSAQVTVNNVLLTHQTVPGVQNNATGSFTLGGSGTATIQ